MRKSNCRNINVQKVGYMILFISFCKPNALEHFFPLVETIFDIYRLMVMEIIFLIFLSKRKKLNSFVLAFIAYATILIFFSAVNHRLFIGSFMQLGSIISIIFLLDIMLEKNVLFCLDIMLLPLEILIYLNLLSVILYPNGMYSVTYGPYNWSTDELWLLGMDNSLTPIFLITISISILRSYYIKGHLQLTLRSLCLLIGCIMTVVIRKPTTVLIVTLISSVYLLFRKTIAKIEVLNIWIYTTICILFFLCIILLRQQNALSFIVEDILGKTLTFTGRTAIWDKAIETIRKQTFWGYGMLSSDDAWLIVGHSHAHNMYLNVLIRGGFLACIPFLVMHVLSIIKLSKSGRNYLTDFISIIFFCMMLAFQVEAYSSHFCYLIIYLAYRSDFLFSLYSVGNQSEKWKPVKKNMGTINENSFVKKGCCY